MFFRCLLYVCSALLQGPSETCGLVPVKDWVTKEINMAAKGALERGITTIWQKLLTVVNNALVYLDSRTAEWMHWCGSLQDLIDAGALNVCDIASRRVSV